METQNTDETFKVILIGESGVGKSALMVRFADDVFDDTQGSTVGVDFRSRNIEVDTRNIKVDTPTGKRTIRLQLWDTAGQEKFRVITRAYYRGCDAAILCYDVTDADSFNRVSDWMDDLSRFAEDDVIKFLVATKGDLMETKKRVPEDAAEAKAREFNATFMTTSAKNNVNVDALFIDLATKLVLASKRKTHTQTEPTIKPMCAEPAKSKVVCCYF